MDKKFYFRFNPIGIDVADEKEVKKYNDELISFAALEKQFALLETAYNNKLKERADIIVDALPCVENIAELAVFHNIKYKLFSRSVKWQKFSLCATSYEENGCSCLYFYDSHNITEVRQMFENFINEHKIPDFSKWEKVNIT